MDFDLNPESYKKEELLIMFELDTNFSKQDLEKKENLLIDKVNRNDDISIETKNKITKFLKKAKKRLLFVLDDKDNNAYKYQFKETRLTENFNDTHFIQEREKPPYIYSYPSDIQQGVINPLKKRTLKKYLNIDTRFRMNYYSSPSTNFNFQLPTKFSSVINMQLTSFEQLTSYYVISKQLGNNFFLITIPNFNESIMITIPDSNYTPNDLFSYINTVLQNTTTSFLKYIEFIYDLNTNNTGTASCIIKISDTYIGTPFQFSLDFQTDIQGNSDLSVGLPLKFGWLIGFRNGLYCNCSSYKSEGIVDLTGPKYIYLVVEDYNNNVGNTFYSAFTSYVLNKNVLARISIQTGVFHLNTQNSLLIITSPREYFGPVDINKLQIQILDEYGRVLNLNNMDYSFCLTFDCVYDI
jgi:hypothetical protein